MNRIVRHLLPLLGLCIAGTAVSAQAPTAFAITTNAQGVQQLVRFNPAAPGSVTTIGPTGVNLVGIDFRPATNELFGYDGNRLYILSVTTGVATQNFDVNNTTGNVGFDFNPVVDRIRVVDASGTNLRLNQLTGMSTADPGYTFAMGDVNFGRVPSFTSVAYTNNDNDLSTATSLFGIDATLGQLVLISNPNGGTVATIGNLGIGAFSSVTGFDILTVGGINTAFFAATSVGASTSHLYTLNLTTGAATLVGGVGLSTGVQGLALTAVPEPGTWALMAAGLAGLGVVARRRRAQR